MESYSAIKKNKIMSFEATWMVLEIIIWSKVSQRKTNIIWYHLHMELKIWKTWTFFVVQSLSCVWLFVTPWTAACQVSLSFTISWSLLKLMSIESVMPSNHLILCCPFSCPQSFPASGSFPMSRLFTSSGQRIGASASVLPMNIQNWFPLELTGLISLQSKGLSRVFFSITAWKHQFFGIQPSLWANSHIHDYWKNYSFD